MKCKANLVCRVRWCECNSAWRKFVNEKKPKSDVEESETRELFFSCVSQCLSHRQTCREWWCGGEEMNGKPISISNLSELRIQVECACNQTRWRCNAYCKQTENMIWMELFSQQTLSLLTTHFAFVIDSRARLAHISHKESKQEEDGSMRIENFAGKFRQVLSRTKIR